MTRIIGCARTIRSRCGSNSSTAIGSGLDTGTGRIGTVIGIGGSGTDPSGSEDTDKTRVIDASLHQLDAMVQGAHLMAQVQNAKLKGAGLGRGDGGHGIRLQLGLAEVDVVSIRIQILLQLADNQAVDILRGVLDVDGTVPYVLGHMVVVRHTISGGGGSGVVGGGIGTLVSFTVHSDVAICVGLG